ncbi:MAG: hypothetical protein ACLTWE_06570 [Dysgonomonas mossii]|uniref:hypothetical protein n=1 Tax=Dysgonomonas TaxID=156973 RepID=UPI00208EDB91|nr:MULTISPECIES: hypothetical protein [Dysgonomonas]
MKRIYIILVSALISMSLYSQSVRDREVRKDFSMDKYQSNISRDIFGYLQYEDRRGGKASLKKDIFDNWIYSDNRNNEVKYSKEYWNSILQDFHQNDKRIFQWLIEMYADQSNYKEEYKVDILGYQQYENNKGQRASLKKDIFDAWVYSDSRNNEIKYSKEYREDMLRYSYYDDMDAFFRLKDMCGNLSNYKEEYKIDIFGYQQYQNNQGEKASLKKDIFDRMVYEDNKGTKIELDERDWSRLLRKYHSDKEVFMMFIQRYLFDN